MNYKIVTLAALSFFLVFEIFECSETPKNFTFNVAKKQKLKVADKSTWAGLLLKFNSALVAYNTKKEYEIGKKIAKIINAKNSVTKISTTAKGKKKQNQKVLATDSMMMKSHMEAVEIYNNILKNGWNNKKSKLNTQSYEIRNKVLSLAIKNEKINLVKDLVNKNIIRIETHNYAFAVEIACASKTEVADEIVQFLSVSSPHLGFQASASQKLDLGFALFPIFDAIQKNNFPLLRRALDEGLNPNTEISGYGSLLCLSVIAQCAKCVEILVKRNAEVNTHMKMKFLIPLEATKQTLSVDGWTPLMVAVGDGQDRIIKALIASGVAEISRASLHDNLHHARAVARDISDKMIRLKNLDLLIPNTIELNRLSKTTTDKDFLNAIITGNYSIVDSFLLQMPKLIPKIPSKLNISKANIIENKIKKALSSENISLIYN